VSRSGNEKVIDRTLGIVGVALALLTGVVQYFFPQAPNWAPLGLAIVIAKKWRLSTSESLQASTVSHLISLASS
jgi:hypothetical protein